MSRFYLIEGMTNFYSFIWDSLEWPFSEFFFSDASLWNQYKFIVFNIFSSKIWTISLKTFIITVTTNKKTNELTIYAKLCWNPTKFYRLEILHFFISGTPKIESVWEFFEWLFHYRWQLHKKLYRHISNENAILCYSDNVHLSKYFPIKVP